MVVFVTPYDTTKPTIQKKHIQFDANFHWDPDK